MRVALISDIHSNLPGLEAVLKAIKKHRPERIISLGDQVNLGPLPRETLGLLRAEGVTCLHGNHERYILSAMRGDPDYAGANFASLRYNAQRLTPEEITFPETLRIGPALLCHAFPGDDRFPMFNLPVALPRLRAMRFDEPTHILCGHGHNPTHIRMGNLTLDSIGSAGCMDDAAPGTVSYTIAEIEEDVIGLRPFTLAYDTSVHPSLFLRSGMADFCPIMAHIICLQMMYNRDYLMRFVPMALELSQERGEEIISEATWQETDARFPWPDGVGTREFWANARR